MKKNVKLMFVWVLCAAVLVGCGVPAQTAMPTASVEAVAAQTAAPAEKLTGGVLCLKINPEIALHYDENGKVTRLEGRNNDGARLLEDFTGYEGKDTAQVLEELVDLIGKAGYFVEEADGTARKIVLELDPGSQVPHDRFLEDMAVHVKLCVESKSWVGERDYEYDDLTVPTTAAAEPAPTETTAPASGSRCPVCYDDDCDDGKYCDDYDDRAENEREAERRKNGTPCTVCGEYDCDDGAYCDDWDDRHENRHHDD